MVNIKKTLLGTASFLAMYLFCAITQYLIPPLINITEDLLGTTIGGTIGSILWFGLIIIWVIAFIIVPVGLMIIGITEQNNDTNPIFLLTGGVVYALFGMALLYFSWYMLTPLAGVFTYAILTGLFWIALIIQWVMNIIIVPAYMILEGKQNN